MHERDIRPEHILTYEAPKDYAVYAASVVIKPEIKKKQFLSHLGKRNHLTPL